MLRVALALSLFLWTSPSRAQETEQREERIESALRGVAYSFDPLTFISASRSLVTGLLEVYCAANLLIPPVDRNYQALDVVLGVGCLIGSATLFTMGIRRLRFPPEETRARIQLDELYRLRAAGQLGSADLDRFEDALSSAAARSRRRRWVSVMMGVLNLAATATLAGLAARGRIDRNAGTSIATGTGIVGALSLSALWFRAPAETEWTRYRAPH